MYLLENHLETIICRDERPPCFFSWHNYICIYNTCNFQCTGVLWGCVSKYIAFEMDEFNENGGIDAKQQPCTQYFFTNFFFWYNYICIYNPCIFYCTSALWDCVSNDKLAWRVPTYARSILTWSKQVISYILTYIASTTCRYLKIGGYHAKREPFSQSLILIFWSDLYWMLAT